MGTYRNGKAVKKRGDCARRKWKRLEMKRYERIKENKKKDLKTTESLLRLERKNLGKGNGDGMIYRFHQIMRRGEN